MTTETQTDLNNAVSALDNALQTLGNIHIVDVPEDKLVALHEAYRTIEAARIEIFQVQLKP